MDDKLKQEIIDLIKSLTNQDSIEIGNSKTGVIKVYVNFDDPDGALMKVDHAVTLLQAKRKEILGE
jgi:hypothetical protein